MTKLFDNQRGVYPIVLIPDKILNSLKNGPDEFTLSFALNVLRPQLPRVPIPQKPTDEITYKIPTSKIKIANAGYLMVVIVVSLICGFGLSKSILQGVVYTILIMIAETIVFFVLGLSLFRIEDDEKTMKKPRDLDELKELTIKYENDITAYKEKSELAYQKYLVNLAKFDSTIDQKRQQIKVSIHQENLKPEIKATRGSPSLKRGLAELKFLELLQSELRDLIFIDMVISYNSKVSTSVYTPDFTLICPKTDLHIDIEIDEPYSIKEKLPIHYINCGDEERDNYFLEHNWCVVRFSEFQIIKNPMECIETLKSVYDSLLILRNTYLTKLDPQNCWTYEDSFILQNKRYRESYLS